MRQEKQLLLDEISDGIQEHNDSFIIFRYSGIKANSLSTFRTDVAGVGGSVEMVRKRLLLKAADKLGIELDLAKLPGHIGLVLAGEDPVETAKIVYDFQHAAKDNIEVLAGRFDGALYDAESVKKLSKLPNKEGMQAQLLAVLEAPMSQSLAVMDSLLTSVIYCLDDKIKQTNETN